MRIACPIQIVVALVMLGFGGCSRNEHRWVNEFEITYERLSYDLSEPALCYKCGFRK